MTHVTVLRAAERQHAEHHRTKPKAPIIQYLRPVWSITMAHTSTSPT